MGALGTKAHVPVLPGRSVWAYHSGRGQEDVHGIITPTMRPKGGRTKI